MTAKTESKAIAISMLSAIATTSTWGAGKFIKQFLFAPMDDQTLLCAPAALLALALSATCVFLAASVVGSK